MSPPEVRLPLSWHRMVADRCGPEVMFSLQAVRVMLDAAEDEIGSLRILGTSQEAEIARLHAENQALRAELDQATGRTVLMVTSPAAVRAAMQASAGEADGTVLRTTFAPVREWVLDKAAGTWREQR